MKYGRYGWSHLFISWGVGAAFLWIGLDIFSNSDVWIGYLPEVVPGDIPRETALRIVGVVNIVIGVSFVLRLWQKLAAFIAVLELIGILINSGIDATSIRDVGLLGAALALLKWPVHYRKQNKFTKLFHRNGKRKKKHDDEEEDDEG
jgi:uncharacterized membrane protein YphA (DoxX/SURF4 family)